MKLLDTNVVVYAIGRAHRYKAPCARLLEDVARGAGEFNVDTEALQQILYLYTARRERERGLATCADLLLLFPDPFPIGRRELVLAHQNLTRYSTLLPRDAIHAAVVQAYELEGIVSSDRVFGTIENLVRFDPLALYPEQ